MIRSIHMNRFQQGEYYCGQILFRALDTWKWKNVTCKKCLAKRRKLSKIAFSKTDICAI